MRVALNFGEHFWFQLNWRQMRDLKSRFDIHFEAACTIIGIIQ